MLLCVLLRGKKKITPPARHSTQYNGRDKGRPFFIYTALSLARLLVFSFSFFFLFPDEKPKLQQRTASHSMRTRTTTKMRNTLFRLKGEKREKEREKKVVSDTKKRHQTAHKKSLIGPFTTPTKIYARDYVITYTEKIEINKSTTGGGSLVCFFFFLGENYSQNLVIYSC